MGFTITHKISPLQKFLFRFFNLLQHLLFGLQTSEECKNLGRLYDNFRNFLKAATRYMLGMHCL